MKRIKFVIKKVLVKDIIRKKYLKKKIKSRNAWSRALKKKYIKALLQKFKRKQLRYRLQSLNYNRDGQTFMRNLYLSYINLNWNFCNFFYIYELSRLRVFFDKNIQQEDTVPKDTYVDQSFSIFGFFVNKEERILNSFNNLKLSFYSNFLIWNYKKKLGLEENYEKFLEKIVSSVHEKLKYSKVRYNTLLNYNHYKYASVFFFETIKKYQIIISKITWFFTMLIIYGMLTLKVLIPWLNQCKNNILDYYNIVVLDFYTQVNFVIKKLAHLTQLNDTLIILSKKQLSILTEKFFFNNLMLNIGCYYDVVNILIIKQLPQKFIDIVVNTDFMIKLLDILVI
uniref:Mp05-like protein n=1 Tax=Heterostelium pallidum TaxID=13642 RepID=B2XX20_HETPA|nr:Mp05-like protein [Heterostelium pallidum]